MDEYRRQTEKCDILEDARDAIQEWLELASPPLPRRRRVMDYVFELDLDLHTREGRLRQLREEVGLEHLAGANVTPFPEREK